MKREINAGLGGDCSLSECTVGVCPHPEKGCHGTCVTDYVGGVTKTSGDPVVPARLPAEEENGFGVHD